VTYEELERRLAEVDREFEREAQAAREDYLAAWHRVLDEYANAAKQRVDALAPEGS